MNWNNIDTEDTYEMSLAMLESYTFDTLMLEIECNVREINAETVKRQAMESLASKFECAIEILNANLESLTSQAIENRAK